MPSSGMSNGVTSQKAAFYQLFLTSALVSDEWLHLRPVCLSTGKEIPLIMGQEVVSPIIDLIYIYIYIYNQKMYQVLLGPTE
jgi:hypothetical protein